MRGLTEFSGGYFATDLRAEEYSTGPVVARQLYDYIVEELYSETSVAPWFTDGSKVGNPYFRVSPESGLPSDVIGLPERHIEGLDITDDLKPRLFLIAKPSFANFLTMSLTIEERIDEQTQSV